MQWRQSKTIPDTACFSLIQKRQLHFPCERKYFFIVSSMQNLNRSTDHFHDFTSLSYWKNFQTSLIFLFPFPTLEFYISQRKKNIFSSQSSPKLAGKANGQSLIFFIFCTDLNLIQFSLLGIEKQKGYVSDQDWIDG